MISAIEGIQGLYERAVVHSDPFRFPAKGGSPALFVTDGRDDDPNTKQLTTAKWCDVASDACSVSIKVGTYAAKL